MKFVMEHEMAFDQEALGFPSIQGCHAIVLKTSLGLYGMHVAGNSADDRWAPLARLFRQFLNSLYAFHHLNASTRLYGCSFVGNNQRGYSGGQGQARQKWKAELKTYADALGYHGKISGYDLFQSFGNGASAYVEYRPHEDKCDVFVRRWDNAEHPGRVPNPALLEHRVKTGTADNPRLMNLVNAVTGVNRDNLVQIHKEKLG